MSWQPYVDDSLINEGFRHASILSHEGQTWATSTKFGVTQKEAKKLLPALEGDVDAEKMLKERGFTVAGTRYALSRLENEDDEVRYLVGRCKENGQPSRGVIVARTARTLIFGVHDPIYSRNTSFEKCSVSMYVLADMLSGMSF